jgi:hypothetical protein
MKKMAVIIIAVLALSLLIIAGCDSKPKPASINMTDGLWEISTLVDIPGVPEASKKPFSFTTCLTKNDLVPKAKTEADSKCEVRNKTITGNAVSYETVCGDVSSKGTMTYAGSSFTGASETTMKREGKTMVMKAVLTGKYIGPCPDKK